MNKRELQQALAGLRERYGAPYNLADRQIIQQLYKIIIGRSLHRGCQNCYHDAVIEMWTAFKRNNIMNEKKYWLKAGAVIMSPAFHDGKVFTNDNLTDEVAAEYLAQFPARAYIFARVEEVKKARKARVKAQQKPAEEMKPAEEEPTTTEPTEA